MAAFVIQYNRVTGVKHVTEFQGTNAHREALEHRLRLESERTDQNVEIASLNSDSLATVKKTHSRYFTANFALT